MRPWGALRDAVDVVERGLSATPGWRGWLLRMTGLALPFLVYWAMLRSRLPLGVLFAACCSGAALDSALPIGVLLWLALRSPGWLGKIGSLTLILALFSLPLLALWGHIVVNPSILGGLLPVSDANWYYYDARRLGDGHLLYFSARRPLFTGMLATLLAVTGQNLQATVAILVAVSAVACFLLAEEVRASHGPVPAAIVVMLLFFFQRSAGGSGTTLTETLGLPLGIIAFAVLWRGARACRSGTICLGLGLLTLALTARAGPFLVLPAVMFGGAWSLGRRTGRPLRFLARAAATIALGFGVNAALGRLLAEPTSPVTAFSNFSQTLYGLAVGGKGWTQVQVDHPGAREGAEIYSLAWQAFRARPMDAVVGSLRMWRQYLPPYPSHAYAFAPEALQAGCYVLGALGIALCIRRHRQPLYGLLAAAAVGHLTSIPFVPPIDAGLRVYAATIPILVLVVALAAGELASRAVRLMGHPGPAGPATLDGIDRERTVWVGASAGVGLGLAALVVIGPLVTYGAGGTPRFQEVSCPTGKEPVYVRVRAGSFLRIVEDSPGSESPRVTVPEVRAADLRRATEASAMRRDAARFAGGHTLMNTDDLKGGRHLWLIVPTHLLPAPPGIARICGQAGADGLFHGDSVQGQVS